jgi:hypothetical protein
MEFMKSQTIQTICIRLLLLASLSGIGWTLPPADAQPNQVFTGEITDTICARYKGHKHMMDELKSMGGDKKSCIQHCREQLGASLVLYDEAKQMTYELANQDKVAPFAGQKVRVTGKLEKNKKIDVTDLQRAN